MKDELANSNINMPSVVHITVKDSEFNNTFLLTGNSDIFDDAIFYQKIPFLVTISIGFAIDVLLITPSANDLSEFIF